MSFSLLYIMIWVSIQWLLKSVGASPLTPMIYQDGMNGALIEIHGSGAKPVLTVFKNTIHAVIQCYLHVILSRVAYDLRWLIRLWVPPRIWSDQCLCAVCMRTAQFI